jgi:hypothetical protein
MKFMGVSKASGQSSSMVVLVAEVSSYFWFKHKCEEKNIIHLNKFLTARS